MTSQSNWTMTAVERHTLEKIVSDKTADVQSRVVASVLLDLSLSKNRIADEAFVSVPMVRDFIKAHQRQRDTVQQDRLRNYLLAKLSDRPGTQLLLQTVLVVRPNQRGSSSP